MFNPNQDQINNYYRQDQERYASQAQFAQENSESLLNRIRNIQISSRTISVLAVIVLLVVMGLNTASASAQEGMDNKDAGSSGTPDDANMLYLRGAIINVQQADYETAIRLLDEINAGDPDFAPAYTGRAYVYFLQGNYELALEEATVAYELNPADGAVYYVLAETHFAMGNYNDANFFYEGYQLWVETFDSEPILIVGMVGENSFELMSEHWDITIAENSAEEIS